MNKNEINNSLFSFNPFPLWVYDYETLKILDVNIAAIEYYGYSKEEFISLTLKDLVSPQEVPKLISAHINIKNREGNIYFGLFTHQKKSGQLIHMEVNGHYINFQDKKCIMSVCQDISSSIKHKSEADQLMNSSLDVFCTVNEQGTFVYVSAASLNLWGYSPEELIGTSFQDLLLEEDVPKTNEIIAALLNGKEVNSFINRYKKKDGSIAYNLWSAKWDPSTKLRYAVAKDYKEKIEHEEKILLSEQRFKALVQDGSDLIGILDAEGKYMYVSPTSISILGIAPEEFIGKSPFEFIHPDDVESTLASLQKITTENRVIVEPFRFQDRNKEWRWIETVLTNMLDNPAVKGIVANSRDITETLKSRKQIESSELFNRTVLESSPDCLKVLDAEGRLQFMNFNGLCQMEIDDFSSFKNKPWLTLWGSENEALVKDSLNKALNGEIVHFTALCPTAKGTRKWWDVMLSPVGKTGDPVEQIISVSRDITVQKKEEQRLKLLESVITNTNDSILITEAEPFDEPGPRIIYVNEAFTKMTGYTAEEVIGKSPRILQGPNSNKEDLVEIGRKMRKWESCELTTINYKKNGDEFWINFTLTPVANEKGWYTHWIAIERDVTKQKNKELEKELLAKISLNFNSINDYAAAIKELCISISNFGNFDWVELWTSNFEKSHLQLLCHHVSAPEDEKFYDYSRDVSSLQLSESLAGKVWSGGAQLLWNDVDTHKEFVRRDAAKKIGLKSVLGMPLIFNDEVIGVIQIGTKYDVNYLKNYARIFQKLEKFIGSELNRKKLENDLSHLFNAIPDIICLGDFKGRFLRINKAGCDLLGYSEEEILYHSFYEFIHPEDKDIANNEILRLKDGETSFKFENRYLTKSGEVIWLSWYCNTILEEELIYATAKNITEEKKLRELNRVARSLAKIGSWEVNVVNQKVYWSDEVHLIHETDPETFVPTLEDGINFYREDFREMVALNIEKSITSGEKFDFEAVLVTAKKKEVWVRAIGNTEFLDGKCKRIFGSFQNINDRKDSENRLQSLSENLPGVVYQYIMHPDGTDSMQFISGMVEQLWGYTTNEVMGNINLLWDQIKLGGDLEQVKASLLKSIQTKSRWTSRFRIVLPSGELKTHFSNGGFPIFLADGSIIFNVIVLDITQEAKNEDLHSQASQMARIGSWEFDLINKDGDNMYWSPMVKEILELDDSYKSSYSIGLELHIGESKERIKNAFDNLIKEGVEFDEELLLLTGKGNERWVRCIGKGETANNKLSRIYGCIQDIHERKVAEKNILQANERFEKVTEATNDAIWDWDIANKTFYRSKPVEKFLVKEASDSFTEKGFWKDNFHPDDFAKIRRSIVEAIVNPSVNRWELEYRVLNNRRKILYVINRGVIIRNNEGKAIRMVGAMTDISEQKKSEKSILQANERFEKVTEATNDAIWDWDIVNKTCQRSRAIKLFFGEKASRSIFNNDFWKDSFHPEDLPKLQESINKAILDTTCNRWEFEYRLFNELGKTIYVIDRGVIIRNSEGKAIRMVGAMADISKQKKSDEENKFKANLLSRIGQAAIATNIDGVVNYWNKAAENIYGWAQEEAIGKNIVQLTTPDTSKEEAMQIMEQLKKGKTWSGEFKVRKKDGTNFPVLINNSPIFDDNNILSGIIGISSNITLEVKNKELLKQYTNELERSNEELEQFAFVASHDLQEPLRMISSFMDLLERKYADQLDEKGHQYIHFAKDGAKRMKQIILDLLEYSRSSRLTEGKEMVDVNELLSEFTQLRRKLISEKNAIITSRDLPSLNTYKAALKQIFHCLLDNALKYAKEDTASLIEISVVENETTWEFSIKDNGIGIDSQFYDKIFIIFQRLHNKDQYSGTGIGLSIAKRHVELLGGRIWLESTLGEGSIFYFTISKTT